MFRSILIYLSTASWARKMVTNWDFAWRAASRFISGETLDDAVRVIRQLNEEGINATLDHLGEHTTNEKEADHAAEEILEALAAIDQTGIRANISIKLTQIGLDLNPNVCMENLRRILRRAAELGNFIRLDMEGSNHVDATLGLYEQMRAEGFTNTGVVIQSYLYRSIKDVRRIIANKGRIRLCKGAYQEPPEIAYPRKRDVDANYDQLVKLMIEAAEEHSALNLSGDGKTPPIAAIATHDPKRLEFAKAYASKRRLSAQGIEFQMLFGIRRDLQSQTAKQGYPVRIYVPYGTEWYPFYVRRLAERPANLWFFVSNFFRR